MEPSWGYSRKEIEKKFDEIVQFAEIEKFLDTPVKRFSSGMFVRLGFAVAAHLEPEILIVDEVLAVGDTDFQKRCLGKMNDITSEGRTVIFVSHNMNIIQRLCQKTILLHQGKIQEIGKTSDVIKTYTSSGQEDDKPEQWIDVWKIRGLSPKKSGSYYTGFWYSSHNLDFNCRPYPDGPLEVKVRIFSDKPRTIDSMAISFYDRYGSQLVNADIVALGEQIILTTGMNEISLKIEELHLKPGIYTIGLWLANPPYQAFDHYEQALRLEVVDSEQQKFGIRPPKDGSVTCAFSVEQI